MQRIIQKRLAFFGKSMLWSLCLYALMMLAINWEDVRNVVSGNKPVVVESTYPSEMRGPLVTNPSVSPPSISAQAGALTTILAVVKTISGVTAKAVSH